jgi:hypothetical protein
VIPSQRIEDIFKDGENIMDDLDRELKKYATMHENENSQKKNHKDFL